LGKVEEINDEAVYASCDVLSVMVNNNDEDFGLEAP